jgi:hypothetical protein
LMCANECPLAGRRVAELRAPDFLFTETHPVEMCEIDGRLRCGRRCHNKYMALPLSPRPAEERGTARLGRHGPVAFLSRWNMDAAALQRPKLVVKVS